ncbi:MAG: hypothetical protein ISS72_06855 [Candidatus Brocadiae bacterium]|nr:hypothetical protein [Candidatus Brocadiia bacterium]
MDIIGLVSRLVGRVKSFAERARRFYYAVMLAGHECPQCGSGLVMTTEGKCGCTRCGYEFDPTVAFQRCPECGGRLELRVQRYRCSECGKDAASRFLFDGLVFDAEYFRVKMAESRQRKREQRERVRQMLAECRSRDLSVPAAELSSIPGLVEALDGLVGGAVPVEEWQPAQSFNLRRYQSHMEAHIRDFPLSLGELPALVADARKDLIWRFIAVIFMAHAGLLDVWQEGSTIWVMKHETNGEGQDILGDTEAVDGVERLVGRAEA